MNHYDIIETQVVKVQQTEKQNQIDWKTDIYHKLKERNHSNELAIRKFIRHYQKMEHRGKVSTEPSSVAGHWEDKGQQNKQKIGIQRKVMTPLILQKSNSTPKHSCKRLKQHQSCNQIEQSKKLRDQQISNSPAIQYFEAIVTDINTQSPIKPAINENKMYGDRYPVDKMTKHQQFTNNLRSYILKEAFAKKQKKETQKQCEQNKFPRNSFNGKQKVESPKYQHLSIKSLGFGMEENQSQTNLDVTVNSKRKRLRVITEINQKLKNSDKTDDHIQKIYQVNLTNKANKNALPSLNKSHLQRNRRCLEMFLRCNQQKQFQKFKAINLINKSQGLIGQSGQVAILSKRGICFRVNTLPLKKNV